MNNTSKVLPISNHTSDEVEEAINTDIALSEDKIIETVGQMEEMATEALLDSIVDNAHTRAAMRMSLFKDAQRFMKHHQLLLAMMYELAKLIPVQVSHNGEYTNLSPNSGELTAVHIQKATVAFHVGVNSLVTNIDLLKQQIKQKETEIDTLTKRFEKVKKELDDGYNEVRRENQAKIDELEAKYKIKLDKWIIPDGDCPYVLRNVKKDSLYIGCSSKGRKPSMDAYSRVRGIAAAKKYASLAAAEEALAHIIKHRDELDFKVKDRYVVCKMVLHSISK
jgi:hypothetical protein